MDSHPIPKERRSIVGLFFTTITNSTLILYLTLYITTVSHLGKTKYIVMHFVSPSLSPLWNSHEKKKKRKKYKKSMGVLFRKVWVMYKNEHKAYKNLVIGDLVLINNVHILN